MTCVHLCVSGGGGGVRSEVGRVERSRRPESLHSDLCANWPLVIESLGKENGDGRRKTSCVSREWKQPFDCLIKTAHCDSHCLSSSPNLNCCPPPPPRPHLISLLSPSASRSLSLQSLPNTSSLQRLNLPGSVLRKERGRSRRIKANKRNGI